MVTTTVLTNMSGIPAIVLCLRRGDFVLAMLGLMTFLWSSLYHLADTVGACGPLARPPLPPLAYILPPADPAACITASTSPPRM